MRTLKRKHTDRTKEKPSSIRPSLLASQSRCRQGSNTPKSGSGESESVSSAWILVESAAPSKQRWVVWPKPVMRKNRRSGRKFSGAVMKPGVWMSPVADLMSSVRCDASSGQSRRRWCDELRSSPQGHGSAVIFGGGSVGERLQNTRHSARVSAQSLPWRWLGNLNDGVERGSICFHRLRNSARACDRSQVFVVRAKRQGVVGREVPSLASSSALSLPLMLQWAGHHTVEICQPRSRRVVIVSSDLRAYSWLSLFEYRVSIAALLSIQINTLEGGIVVVRRVETASCTAWSSASYTSALAPRWHLP
jgi:hypothetical protein